MCQGSQGSSMGGYGGMGRSSMPSGPYSQAPQQSLYNPRAGGASPQWNPMQGGMQKPYQPPMSSPNNYQSPPFVPPGADTQGYNPAKDGNPADPVFQAMGYQNSSGAGFNEPAYQRYGPDQHQPGRIPGGTSPLPVNPQIPWQLPDPSKPDQPPMSSPNYESPPIFNQDIYGQAKPGLQPRGYQSPPWNPYMYQGK